MLREGEAAPDFALPDQDGEPVSLADLRGSTTVLYFYPRADTPAARNRRAAFATTRPTTNAPAPA